MMLQNAIIFLAVLSILVLVHEFGHFAVAKLFKVKVEEFAIGLPFTRAILSIKAGETKYSIYPLLFGGFVRLFGEDGDGASDKRSFAHLDGWKKIAIVSAGVVMNMVLALVTFFVLFTVVGMPGRVQNKVTIYDVVADSPAAKAGFMVQDRIVEVEGKQIVNSVEFAKIINSWAGLGVNITIDRGQTQALYGGLVEKTVERKILHVVPRKDPPKDQGALGVGLGELPYVEIDKCSLAESDCVVRIINQAGKSTQEWVGRIVEGLRGIGKSLIALQIPKDISGPAGIYKLTGEVAKEGWASLFELVAVLSVNLAVFNILPIPALDGGRNLFIVLEMIRRKKLPAEFEQRLNSWGLIIFVIFIGLITLQDLLREGILSKIMGK